MADYLRVPVAFSVVLPILGSFVLGAFTVLSCNLCPLGSRFHFIRLSNSRLGVVSFVSVTGFNVRVISDKAVIRLAFSFWSSLMVFVNSKLAFLLSFNSCSNLLFSSTRSCFCFLVFKSIRLPFSELAILSLIWTASCFTAESSLHRSSNVRFVGDDADLFDCVAWFDFDASLGTSAWRGNYLLTLHGLVPVLLASWWSCRILNSILIAWKSLRSGSCLRFIRHLVPLHQLRGWRLLGILVLP